MFQSAHTVVVLTVMRGIIAVWMQQEIKFDLLNADDSDLLVVPQLSTLGIQLVVELATAQQQPLDALHRRRVR